MIWKSVPAARERIEITDGPAVSTAGYGYVGHNLGSNGAVAVGGGAGASTWTN